MQDTLSYFTAKVHQCQLCKFELLQPKGDAHDRHAEQGAYDNRFNGKGQA